jgi:asparagine synthase (glutamine-hydrolysing)
VSGICGWVGPADGSPAHVLAAMSRRFAWSRPGTHVTLLGEQSALAAVGSTGTVAIVEHGPIRLAVHGHPTLRSGTCDIEEWSHCVAKMYAARGSGIVDDVGGDFALAIVDERDGSAMLAVDRIGIRNIVYQDSGAALIFGATSDVVAAHPLAKSTVDPQALYNYVYFHMVPGPETIYREHARLAPAHYLLRKRGGRSTARRYWNLRFVEDTRGTVADFKPVLRAALHRGVSALADEKLCGTFLSGGTDSSTVSGMLRDIKHAPVDTYSIGFDATGYDEMQYARIAARHFKTKHHEYYVTPNDVVAAAPLIAAAYDQPFGNASAVPTYYCAARARSDGIERMLGGDGGDELFGGNDRYAKHYRLAIYERIPRPLRIALQSLLFGVPGAAGIPLLRRGKSYVEQASLPMPARYETYNLLRRLGPENVFSAEFLAVVDQDRPLTMLKKVYDDTQANTPINRMLALDIKFTLADNDLPKVTRTCEIAGVDVGFPLLHDSIVDFSATLPPDFKLRGTRLRYFFKEALRDFLPDATITKKKHGFGLPAGIWLRDDPGLHQLANDALSDLRRRRIFRDELLDQLMTRRLQEHAGYYGTLAWVLMMLEMWFKTHAGAASSSGAAGA